MSPSELIDLIIERAPKLRAAGVRSLALDGDGCAARITLGAPEVALPPPLAEPEPEPSDPLYDPHTYGRESGTPGFDVTDIDEPDDS